MPPLKPVKRVIMAMVAVAIIGYCLYWIISKIRSRELYAQDNRMEHLAQVLESKGKRWRDIGITQYLITVENQGYSQYSIVCPSATLKVANSNLSVEIPGMDGIENEVYRESCVNVYRGLTIERLFDLASLYVHEDPSLVEVIQIEYDDSAGYISYIRILAKATWWSFPSHLKTHVPASFTIRITDFKITDSKSPEVPAPMSPTVSGLTSIP